MVGTLGTFAHWGKGGLHSCGINEASQLYSMGCGIRKTTHSEIVITAVVMTVMEMFIPDELIVSESNWLLLVVVVMAIELVVA